jgi:hypothetical protein
MRLKERKALRRVIARHRQSPDAKWVMPADRLGRLDTREPCTREVGAGRHSQASSRPQNSRTPLAGRSARWDFRAKPRRTSCSGRRIGDAVARAVRSLVRFGKPVAGFTRRDPCGEERRRGIDTRKTLPTHRPSDRRSRRTAVPRTSRVPRPAAVVLALLALAAAQLDPRVRPRAVAAALHLPAVVRAGALARAFGGASCLGARGARAGGDRVGRGGRRWPPPRCR